MLLADPIALSRFAEHEVIIPITVIGELETKRDHPDLGYFARAALHLCFKQRKSLLATALFLLAGTLPVASIWIERSVAKGR